jgi:hypothetical protein
LSVDIPQTKTEFSLTRHRSSKGTSPSLTIPISQ